MYSWLKKKLKNPIIYFFILIFAFSNFAAFFAVPKKVQAQAAPTCTVSLQAEVVGNNVNFSWDVSGLASGQSLHLVPSVTSGGVETPAGDIDLNASPYSIEKPVATTNFLIRVVDSAGAVVCQSNKVVYDSTTGQVSGGNTGNTGNTTPVSSLRLALLGSGTDVWVINTWKICLGLANFAFLLILIFIAAVNILNLNYDTYQIKKILPILIMGILLANFSLFIVRMLLDVANVLTHMFTLNQSPSQFAGALINSPATNPVGETMGLGGLFMWLLFAGAIFVGFLVLGFMFYMRYAVIIIAAIVAPIAFIAMAFPPTQSFFKQWFSWLTKFIFMKPISFFFLYLAYEMRKVGGDNSITSWILTIIMVVLACMVPFKLGGAVGAAWGGVGKRLKGYAGAGAKLGFNKATEIPKAKLGNAWNRTPFGRWSAGRQQELAQLKKEREADTAQHQENIRKRKGGKFEAREERAERKKKNLTRGTEQRTADFYKTPEGKKLIEAELEDEEATGRLKITKRNQMFEIYRSEDKGRHLAQFEKELANSEMRLEKTKDDARRTIAGEENSKHNLIPKPLRKAQEKIDFAQDRIAKSAVGSTEHTRAVADLATFTRERDNAVTNLRRSGTSQATIDQYQRDFLPRLARTRNMAIINKSAYDDVKDEASNKSPFQISGGLKGGGSIGAFAWEHGDSRSFYHNGKTSSSDAAQGLGMESSALLVTLKDKKTAGVAFQGLSDTLHEHNANFLREGTNRALSRAQQPTLDKVKASLIRQGLTQGTDFQVDTTGNVTSIETVALRKVQFDTDGDYQLGGFVNSVVNELQSADQYGGLPQLDPATGQPVIDPTTGNVQVAVQGFSGLGQNVAAIVGGSGT